MCGENPNSRKGQGTFRKLENGSWKPETVLVQCAGSTRTPKGTRKPLENTLENLWKMGHGNPNTLTLVNFLIPKVDRALAAPFFSFFSRSHSPPLKDSHCFNLEKCLLVQCLLNLWLVVCVFRVCRVVMLEESPTSDLAVATRSHSPMPMTQGGLCRVMQRRRQCLASTSRPPRTNRDQF